VRRHLTEFRGGDSLEWANDACPTLCGGCQFTLRWLFRPSELDRFLERGLQIARSLSDSESSTSHLNIVCVDTHCSAEDSIDHWFPFELREPVANVIEPLILKRGICLLHTISNT
jgi:hypothetical protein